MYVKKNIRTKLLYENFTIKPNSYIFYRDIVIMIQTNSNFIQSNNYCIFVVINLNRFMKIPLVRGCSKFE